MKTKRNIKNRLFKWFLIVSAVLFIPFLTNSPWSLMDYIFAFVVLFSSASVYELSTRNIKNNNKRIAVGLAVISVIILIWAWAVA